MDFLLPKSQRNRLVLGVLVVIAIWKRGFLSAVLRVIREMRNTHMLLKQLPGPGKEYEHWLLGHFGGPLIVKEGETLSPELLVSKMVERLQHISRGFREEGLFKLNAFSSSIPGNPFGIIVPTSINVVRELLSHKSMENFNKGIMYKISHPLIGDSVLSTSGKEWAMQRPIVERGFAHEIVGKTIPKIVQTANELAVKWEHAARASGNTAVQDVREDMLKLTMDVIGRAAFGFDFQSITSEVAPLYEPFQTILYTLERRGNYFHEHLLRNVPFLERNIKFNEAIGKLNDLVHVIVKNRREETAEAKAKREADFLDMLLADKNVSSQTAVDNIKTLLFAGHDTTGAALAWFFYLLAAHPAALKRVREEVLTKFGANGDPTYEELESVPFLNACFLETLRLYPSAGFMRRPKHDVEIGGYVFPKLAEVLVLPYILHRDERYWGPQAAEFIPERFLSEGYEEGNTTHNFRMDSLQSRIGRISAKKAYFPFSLGPRNCVGRPLSLAELRVTAIKLLQRFDFKTCEDKEFTPVPLLTLTLNPQSIRLIPVLPEHA